MVGQLQRKLFVLFFGVVWLPIWGDCQPVPVGTWPNMTGGVSNGPASQGLTLSAGQSISVTSNLSIISDDDLVIRGRICLPQATPGSSGVNLTLVSSHGKVLVDDGAIVGAGGADVGNGGKITIDGILVEIRGFVFGNKGGSPSGNIQNDGYVGKTGGTGGDIVLIGVDGISIGKIRRKPFFCVEAGDGGNGERVDVSGNNNTTVTGGTGGKGGDVIFEVRPNSGPKKVTVTIIENVAGGTGGTGGFAIAKSTLAAKSGNATSTGGKGGPGGTVEFPSALVDPPPAGKLVVAGNGGKGGTGSATGGNGSNAWFFSGDAGGNATVTGGNGSPAGSVPVIPLLFGSTLNGFPGFGGGGGDASGISGNGGNGTTRSFFVFTTNGGPSGISAVTGGPNAAGTKAPVVAPKGPATTTVVTGATGMTNFAAGQP